jgi:hypothetical protein
MGTRAAFWIGDPRNIHTREWLGCKALDGYPSAFPEFDEVKTAEDFRTAVEKLKNEDDFALPSGGWPYPWDGDIFLTDFTYAFFYDTLYVACFHSPFISWHSVNRKSFDGGKDVQLRNIPAPTKYNSKQPDSIIIVSAR